MKPCWPGSRSLVRSGTWLALCCAAASGVLAEPGDPARGEGGGGDPHGEITDQLDCAACHSPAGWRSIEQGRPGAGFDHARTGFPLTGRHARTACTECHRAGRQVTRACHDCHRDAHQGRLGATCDRCHSSLAWHPTDAFAQHRRTRLPLSGMHALADCTECHRRTSESTFAPVPADCYACHADDYRRSDVHPRHTGSADGQSPPLPRDCAMCHRAIAWSPAAIAPGAFLSSLALAAPPEHELRFPIANGQHRDARCLDCHVDATGRGPVRCTGCHAHEPATLRAQHLGVPGGGVASGCLGCHPGGAAR